MALTESAPIGVDYRLRHVIEPDRCACRLVLKDRLLEVVNEWLDEVRCGGVTARQLFSVVDIDLDGEALTVDSGTVTTARVPQEVRSEQTEWGSFSEWEELEFWDEAYGGEPLDFSFPQAHPSDTLDGVEPYNATSLGQVQLTMMCRDRFDPDREYVVDLDKSCSSSDMGGVVFPVSTWSWSPVYEAGATKRELWRAMLCGAAITAAIHETMELTQTEVGSPVFDPHGTRDDGTVAATVRFVVSAGGGTAVVVV